MDKIPQRPENENGAVRELRRIGDLLEHFLRLYDEHAGADLDARYPYGDHKTDRWGRGRR